MSDALALLSEMATNSPRSQALASLHMTPEELARHTQEMRDFLSRTTFSMSNTSPKSASSSTAESSGETVAGTSRSSVTTAIPSNGDTTQPTHPIRTRRQAGTFMPSNASSPGPSRTLRPRSSPNKTQASPIKTTNIASKEVVGTSNAVSQMPGSTPRSRKLSVRASASQRTPDAPIPTSSFYDGDTSQKPKSKLAPPAVSSSDPQSHTVPCTVIKGSAPSSNGPRKIRLVFTSAPSVSSEAVSPSTSTPSSPAPTPMASTAITSTSLTASSVSANEPGNGEDEDESDTDEVPFTLPPGPRTGEKPSWSYAALIGQAILASKHRKLSLNQIYQYISMAYPYYKKDAPGWRNSIRHNLSLNGSFYKTERSTFKRGKGSLWAIKEEDLECFANGNFIRKGRAVHLRKRKLPETVGLKPSQTEASKKPKLTSSIPGAGATQQAYYTAAGYPAVLPPGTVVAAAAGPNGTKFPQLFYYSVPPGMIPQGVIPQLYTLAPVQAPVPGNLDMAMTDEVPVAPLGNASSGDASVRGASPSSGAPSSTTAIKGAIVVPPSALPPAALPPLPKTASSGGWTSSSALTKVSSTTLTISPMPPGFPPASLNLKHLSTFHPRTPTKPDSSTSSNAGYMPSSSPVHAPPAIARQKKTPPAVDKNRLRCSRSRNKLLLGFRESGSDSPMPPSSPPSSSPVMRSSSTLPASPLPNSSPLPLSSLPSSPVLPSSPLPSSSPISSPSTFLHELEFEDGYESEDDDGVSAKALLAQFQAVSAHIESNRNRNSTCTSASSSVYEGDDIELKRSFSSGAEHSSDDGFGVDIVNEDLAIPKELELDIPNGNNREDVTTCVGNSQGSDECTRSEEVQPPPLTPNGSSSSPIPVQTPEEQKPVPSGATQNATVRQTHGSLLVLEAEVHRNVGVNENTTLKLQPSFELNAKRLSVKDDDSPESRPRRQRSAPPDSPPLSPTSNTKAGKLSSARVATEMIYRALEFKANKPVSPPAAPSCTSKPKTPMGWKSNSSYDLVLNSHKSPMTPFARPITPPRQDSGNSSDSAHRQHTFFTPPPKVRKRKPLSATDCESSEERAQRAEYNASHSTPKITPGERSLRDMFGFSPVRTPLTHRSHLSPQLASLSSFKRSLLPPSPFRTPTSSARLTARKGHPDDRDRINGTDEDTPDPYDPSSDVAEEFARLSEAPVTPMGSSTLFQRTTFLRSPGMPSPGGWRMF